MKSAACDMVYSCRMIKELNADMKEFSGKWGKLLIPLMLCRTSDKIRQLALKIYEENEEILLCHQTEIGAHVAINLKSVSEQYTKQICDVICQTAKNRIVY